MAQLVGRSLPHSRDLRFESSHRQNLYCPFTVNCIEKTKMNKKRPGMAHIKYPIFVGVDVRFESRP